MFSSPQLRMNAFSPGPPGIDFIRSTSVGLTGSKPLIPDATQNTFIQLSAAPIAFSQYVLEGRRVTKIELRNPR
jgi:hypothetical protein